MHVYSCVIKRQYCEASNNANVTNNELFLSRTKSCWRNTYEVIRETFLRLVDCGYIHPFNNGDCIIIETICRPIYTLVLLTTLPPCEVSRVGSVRSGSPLDW